MAKLKKDEIVTLAPNRNAFHFIQLTKVILPTNAKTTMLYNADGLRVKKEDDSETIKSTWDGNNVLAETNAANATQALYTLSPDFYGNFVSQRRGNTSHFALSDALGSVTGLANSAETISDTYLYKAYGEILSSSGSTANPFKWVGGKGYQYDSALQQYYV